MSDEENLEETSRVKLKESIDVSSLSTRGCVFEVDQMYSENESMIPEDFIRNAAVDKRNEGFDWGKLESFDELALEMQDLTPDGGVKKKILSGGTGPINDGNYSSVYHYEAFEECKLLDPVDSTYIRRKAETAQPGLLGLQIALKSMRKKEKSVFLIDSQYAFGPLGCPPHISPRATLLYIIEVIDFNSHISVDEYEKMEDNQRKEMTFDKVLKIANDFRIKGNNLFKDRDLFSARGCYYKGARLLESSNPRDEKDVEVFSICLCKLYSNIAMVCLELHEHELACHNCQLAFDLPGNIPEQTLAKLYYRYSTAKMHLCDFKAARRFLQKAEKLSPGDKNVIQKLFKEINLKDSIEKEKEKIFATKMFSNLDSSSETGSNKD